MNVSCFCVSIDSISIQGGSLSALRMCLVFVYLQTLQIYTKWKFVSLANVSCFCVSIDSIDLYKAEVCQPCGCILFLCIYGLYRSIQLTRWKFVSHANVSCFCVSIDSIDLYKVEVCQPCECVLFLCIYRQYRSIQGRSLSALWMYLVFVYLQTVQIYTRRKFVSLTDVSCFCVSIDSIDLYKAEVCQPYGCVLFSQVEDTSGQQVWHVQATQACGHHRRSPPGIQKGSTFLLPNTELNPCSNIPDSFKKSCVSE